MKNKHVSLIAVLLSGILWGTIGVFNRYYTSFGITANNLVFLRLSMGTGLLFLYLAIRDPKALKFRLKDVWIFAGAGILSIILFQTCYMITIQASSLSLAAILLYTSTVFVMILSAIFFKEKITALKAVGAIIAVVGCALAAGIAQGLDQLSPIVLIPGILSAIGYAFYSIFARAALNRGYKAITMTAWSFLFALVPLAFVADYPTIIGGIQADGARGIVMWILLALATEALPYVLYTQGLTGMETTKAAVTVAIEPIVATLIGVIFFHELMTWQSVLGTVMVLGAIVVLNLPQKETHT